MDKIKQLEGLLEAGNFSSGEAIKEVVSIALSIGVEDDRDLYLQKTALGLAAAGQWKKAQEVVGYIQEPYERAESLCKIADHLILIGDFQQSLSILDEAEKAAGQTAEIWQKPDLLNRIARSLIAAKAYDMADKVWGQAISAARVGENSASIQDSVDCSGVLREIAENLALVGKTEKALEIARAIKSLGKRDGALDVVMKIMDHT